jgi:3-hydroxyisobutyrate dehydrogenase-like beta-hydroxyacid dehydrogenase
VGCEVSPADQAGTTGGEVRPRLDPLRIRTLAVIGFGEVGQCFAAAFAGDLALPVPLALRVGDIEPPGPRRARLQRAAEGHGVRLEDGPGSWLGDADLVLSAVTGDRAVEAAGAAAPFLRPGAVYLDVNTAPKGTMAEVARVIGQRATVIDCAILGLIASSGARAPLLLSGSDADVMTAFLNDRGCRARSIGGIVGDASGVKLLRSVVMKGLEALVIEAFVAAERQGLRTQVVDALEDLGQTPAETTITNLLTTHLRHARRRSVEIDEVRGMLSEAGCPSRMMDAAAAVFERSLDSGIVRGDTPASLEDALARLVPAHSG